MMLAGEPQGLVEVTALLTQPHPARVCGRADMSATPDRPDLGRVVHYSRQERAADRGLPSAERVLWLGVAVRAVLELVVVPREEGQEAADDQCQGHCRNRDDHQDRLHER